MKHPFTAISVCFTWCLMVIAPAQAQEVSLSIKLDPLYSSDMSAAVASREIVEMVNQRCDVTCSSVSLEITSDVTDMTGAFRYLDSVYEKMILHRNKFALELVYSDEGCCRQ